ncbi:MAG: haloacid dehalogenase-like hydrolase [Clostridiales bacterium]|nr:haloacid dehalogenase-like hydrolase [Clostridiales bacterium]
MDKRIALLYDFDYTLTDGYMQQFGLMQDFGYSNVYDLFAATEEVFGNNPDMDMCLNMLGGVLEIAKRNNVKITQEYLKDKGRAVTYYPGVIEWFDKINAIGKEYGYEIEHYVISSGIKEIIDGTSICNKLKRVYSNTYVYNQDGEAIWPCQVVNYTSKVQYIYRVRKNVLDNLADLKDVNAKMEDEDVLPFERIIYLGDSETDIPSFKVVKNSGGLSICVYSQSSEKAKMVAEQCCREGRVNYFVPADYREGSQLYNIIETYIRNIMSKE